MHFAEGNLQTEAQRRFRHGFVLTEQELRRIVDQSVQQIVKATGSGPAYSQYEIRFRNGAVMTTDAVDTVLAQENMGPTAIVRLNALLASTKTDPVCSIEVSFIDPDHDEGPSATSVHYKIGGPERDWVFVTASQLEERIRRVRRFAVSQLRGSGPTAFIAFGAFLLGLLVITMGPARQYRAELTAIDSLSRVVHTNAAVNPAAITLELARRQATIGASATAVTSLFNPFVMMGLLFASLFGLLFLWGYLAPPFNFNWGDYLAHFNRRQTARRFVVGVVIVGIVIGIISNYASRKLGI